MSKQPTKTWQRPASPRYVVSVDNQAKSAFDTKEAADSEAERISSRFPQVIVKVTDSQRDSLTGLEAAQDVVAPDGG